jgi:hypothetical protein
MDRAEENFPPPRARKILEDALDILRKMEGSSTNSSVVKVATSARKAMENFLAKTINTK